jgi:hypothetical protein
MLKEFDLDAPKADKEIRHLFRLETRCTTALFERYFVTSKETNKVWKLLVEVVPAVTDFKIRNLIGVLVVQCAFDVSAYFNLKSLEKKTAALEILEEGIKRVLREKSWNAKPFFSAAKAVREHKFVNEWIWRKPYKKAKSSIQIEVFCKHDLDAFKLNFRFRNKQIDKEIVFPILDVLPSEFIFAECFGKAGWDGDRFKLFSKSGKIVGELSVDDKGNPKIIYSEENSLQKN